VRSSLGVDADGRLIVFSMGWGESASRLKELIASNRLQLERKFHSKIVVFGVDSSEFSSDILDYLAAADLIVTRTGLSSMCEIAVLGKRAVLLMDGDEERDANARTAEQLGFGRTVGIDEASKDIASLIRAMEQSPGGFGAMPNGSQTAADLILEELHD
jgi:UDP-N-acetylglucosamine:LPS N-acetylglucosamine transferase